MEKFNIAKLLKDCPKGMELDCLVFEDVTLYRIDTDTENEYPIRIITKNDNFLDLTKYGTYSNVEEAKCIIFPKGKTTWEGFQRPFKDGDIVVSRVGNPFILKSYDLLKNNVCSYCGIDCCGNFRLNSEDWTAAYDVRFATEEEKAKLFQAIKEKGYYWNSVTKTLEKLVKPIFKVGDRIKPKGSDKHYIIKNIEFDRYILNNNQFLKFTDEHNYELVPNKFDISKLKPFDKVLVRDYDNEVWKIQFFEKLNNILKDRFVCMGGNRYHQCIPYKGNEYLLNTSNKPNDFYKTWEK